MMTAFLPELIAALVSFIFAAIAIPIVVRMCRALGLYDHPNARKMHKVAIPRLGGVVFLPAMIAGFAAGLAFLLGGMNKSFTINISTIAMTSGAIIIYLIGMLDDIKEMKAVHKFIIQGIAAFVFPLCNLIINDLHGFLGFHEIPFMFAYPLTVFVILLIVNAINLIDGIDGLSSGLSFLILSIFGVLYYSLHGHNFSILSCSLAGAVLAFFFYNMLGKVNGNKVFMGDSGSLFLGYVIAYLAIKYQMSNGLVFPYRENSLLISFTLLIIPTFDVVRVAFARLFQGKGIFTPDKTHIHHRIMQAGVTMHWTLFTIITLFVALCSINYGLNIFGCSITIIIAVDIALYSAFIFIIERLKVNIA